MSPRDTPDPLPSLAMEKVRDAQRTIDAALKAGVQAVETMMVPKAEVIVLRERLRGAVCLTAAEASLVEVLVREECAKHQHPPHALLSAREKLTATEGAVGNAFTQERERPGWRHNDPDHRRREALPRRGLRLSDTGYA